MHKKRHLPLIIAHRGASTHAPENTLAAFWEAIEAGADGIEFDVRLTKDGIPVVFHDSTLRRMTKKNLRVINYRAEELQNVDVGSWFNAKNPQKAKAKFSNEKIPTLAHLLDVLQDYCGILYLELKCKNREMTSLVAAVVKVIQNSRLFGNIIIKSFKLDAIAEASKIAPDVRTAALFAPKIMTILRKQSRLIEKARELNADELSLHFSLATHKLVAKAASIGMPTIIWTADHPVWVKRASEVGIHAIITNNPARLIAKRKELFEAD